MLLNTVIAGCVGSQRAQEELWFHVCWSVQDEAERTAREEGYLFYRNLKEALLKSKPDFGEYVDIQK